jgi:hypothetical protein
MEKNNISHIELGKHMDIFTKFPEVGQGLVLWKILFSGCWRGNKASGKRNILKTSDKRSMGRINVNDNSNSRHSRDCQRTHLPDDICHK